MNVPQRPTTDLGIPRTSPPRVALYSHDTMGIGHMRRNLLIAQSLAAPPISATVLLVAGAREASAFHMPAGVDCLTVPSFHKEVDGRYRSRSLQMDLRELTAMRSTIIAAALRAFAPDVFIVDKEPRGALGELDDTLSLLQRRGQTKCVLGLRDVLDLPATVQREWREAGNEAIVHRFFDAVWVYGDPRVYDLIDECFMHSQLKAKVSYTGYLDPQSRLQVMPSDPPQVDPIASPNPYCLCMVGGGQDGARLAEAFVGAALPNGRHGVMVTGPCMPTATRDHLKQRCQGDSRWHIHEFHPEPCRLLAQAERVVAMGGYNTVSEILAFEKPALVVPRVQPRQEQWIRAERLSRMGLLDVLRPDDIEPHAISTWMHSTKPTTTLARQHIDFQGLSRVQSLFADLNQLPATRRSQRNRREVKHAGR